MSFALSPENWIALIAAVVALAALLRGLWEYSRAQRWKKAEFLAQEIKSFRQDVDVRRVLLILDWQDSCIPTAAHEGLPEKTICCSSELLIKALSPHGGYFTNDETVVRLLFDQYLDKLGLFERYVQSGLITVDDLKPYLHYWIAAMCHAGKGSQPFNVIKQLWLFIEEYDYNSVRLLCEAFGHRIPLAQEHRSLQPANSIEERTLGN